MCPRPAAARGRALGLLCLLAIVGLCVVAAPAQALPALRWSAPLPIDGVGTPSAISCPSESLCVAVDRSGWVFTTGEPLAAAPSWSAGKVDFGHGLSSVSCASASLCVAVDDHGRAFASPNPAAGAGSWSGATPIDGETPLTGVSCPTASLCVAVDSQGGLLASTNPVTGAWGSTTKADAGNHLRAVSCAGASQCVAVDDAGNALASAAPASNSWSARRIDAEQGLSAISCQGGNCVAVDEHGGVLASANPVAPSPTWSYTPLDQSGQPAGVSCSSAGLCVAVDSVGLAFAGEDPLSPLPQWAASSADPGHALVGVSCMAVGLCVGVDSSGNAVTARVHEPQATTEVPTEVTEASATLAGAVNPEDALLQQCWFEWGTTVAYGQRVPCASLPSPAGSAQPVAAQLTGLFPNTTYHYRVLATSAVGSGVGGDVAFTTARSSEIAIVHPNPSISGTPASGQRLSCNPGTPAGAVVTLTYAWLRDLVPIPAATRSTYTVRDIDSGHHLQCQVTATDGGGSATARSAFVTVPVQGVPAAAGETRVGTARYGAGRVLVPVACSAKASEGCRITVRVSVVETLRGGRIVAVAADRRSRAAAAPGVRRVLVTLALARARLSAGARASVAAALTVSARRLLSARRRLPAEVAVNGTVIGVIEASLSRQRVLLGGTLGRRAGHRGERRAQAAALARPEPHRAARLAAGPGNVLAPTPYMGWDTYFAYGGYYSEASVLSNASALISLGLRARGYDYVWLDAGWWRGRRGAGGQIAVNGSQWPHGMAWLTGTLHAAGLRVGIYTDAGKDGCGGAGQGSYGHYQQDVNTFAAWGFDAVKVDFCGGVEDHLTPAIAYAAFRAAIEANSSRRPMLLSICNFLQPGQYAEGQPSLGESAFASYSFGPAVGNSWRTNTDVGFPGSVSYKDVLRNMDADAAAPQAAGPGHWNDPDYLGPDQGMSGAQFRSQLSMWAMLAAPLMVSDDLTRISGASLTALQNTEVIAVDQDPAGVQGTLLSTSGSGQVWVKPLGDGSRAVALLNRGSSAQQIRTSARAVGLPAAGSYALRDLWAHATRTSSGAIAARVAGGATVLLRVYPR